MARGARRGLSDGRNGRFRKEAFSRNPAGDAGDSWRDG